MQILDLDSFDSDVSIRVLLRMKRGDYCGVSEAAITDKISDVWNAHKAYFIWVQISRLSHSSAGKYSISPEAYWQGTARRIASHAAP